MALSVVVLLLQLVGVIPPYISPWPLLLGGLVSVVSALILAVGTWPLYAFGQMVADLHAIRGEGGRASGAVPEGGRSGETVPKTGASADNPDELPEL